VFGLARPTALIAADSEFDGPVRELIGNLGESDALDCDGGIA